MGVFRTAERQLSGDTHNTQKSAEKPEAHNEYAMLPPSLDAMRLFQIGIISKKPRSILSVQPHSNPTMKESLGLDWKVVILEQKASTDYSSATITK